MPAVSRSNPAFRERLALYILQLGALAVVLVAAPYKTFELDRYFIPKELALHVAAVLAAVLCVTLARQVTIGMVDWLLVAFLVASLASTALAINRWAAERSVAISFSGLLLFWTAGHLRRVGLVRPLVAALALAVVAGAATSLLQAYGVKSDYFSLNRAPGGTFGNRNFVAHLAAMGTPVVVLAALTARRGLGSLGGAIGIAIVAAALVLSRSRAAWLAVLVLAVPVGLLAFSMRDRWREPRTVRRLFVLGLAAGAGVAAAVALPNTLEWKSESPYLDSAVGLVNYKEGSGRGRLVQYTNSLHLTRAHPLLGVGPGNWPVAYPKYASRNDPSLSQEAGMTANPWPSSDWVAFLSERGVIGVLALLLAVLGLLGRAVRDLGSATARDPERVLTAIALVGTIAATAVVGAFDAVLLLALPTFFFWTLAGALAPPAARGLTIPGGGRVWGPVLVLGLGLIAAGRSATALAAIAYADSGRIAALREAALLDPGNYRIRVRLAQADLSRGDCAAAKVQARAARDLFPNAGEPRRVLAACGGR